MTKHPFNYSHQIMWHLLYYYDNVKYNPLLHHMIRNMWWRKKMSLISLFLLLMCIYISPVTTLSLTLTQWLVKFLNNNINCLNNHCLNPAIVFLYTAVKYMDAYLHSCHHSKCLGLIYWTIWNYKKIEFHSYDHF